MVPDHQGRHEADQHDVDPNLRPLVCAEILFGLRRRRVGHSAARLPPPLAGVSLAMERGCQQNDSLADGCFDLQRQDPRRPNALLDDGVQPVVPDIVRDEVEYHLLVGLDLAVAETVILLRPLYL